MENVLLDGNAYIVPIYSVVTMEVDRLVLCGRHTVTHNIYDDTYTVCDTVNGVNDVYDEANIIHIKGHTRNGKQGVSVLEYARQTIDIAITGDRETLKRFSNGGNEEVS